MSLTIKYVSFAILATLANLVAQEITIQIYQGYYPIYLAMLVGTAAGLVCKYLLDKHYIFFYQSRSTQDQIQKFIAYGLTGALTTLVFWGFELGFEYLFATKLARYLGAIIGLSIGYGVKYQLDNRYVFSKQDY